MQLRERRAGDQLKIGAGEWNEIVDAVRYVQKLRSGGENAAAIPIATPDVRYVSNDTGGDLDRFCIVACVVPNFTPDDNVDEFESNVSFSGIEPDEETLGAFCILLEPLVDGAVGRAVFSGIAICRVDVTDTGARFASEIPGNSGYLETTPTGPCRILWREGAESGVEYAVVRIEGPTDVEFDAVVDDWVAIGSTPESWRYAIKRATIDVDTGAWTAAAGAPALSVTYNKDEDPGAYMHGQDLTLGDATLTPQPVQGPVTAKFANAYRSGVRVYTFSAANPMGVACA